MNQSNHSHAVRNIVIFALLVNGLAWLGPVLGGSPLEPGPGFLLWGVAPILTALIMRYGLRDRVSMGWRLNLRGNGRTYLLGTLALPLTMIVVLGIGLATGLATFNQDATIADYVSAVIPLAVIYLVFGLFEEVGWRGYLVPRVSGWNDGLLGHALVGVIWASWHFPYMNELWGHTDEALLTLLPRFVLGTVVFAVFYGEIRLRTGSVWPAVIMHWLGNTVANSLLSGFNGEGFVTLSPGAIWLTSPGVEGTLMIVVFAVLGGWLYTIRKRRNRIPAVAQASMVTQ